MMIMIMIIIIILLLTAIGLSPGGRGYFTCIQNLKLVTNKFKSGGLHEKHVVATLNLVANCRLRRHYVSCVGFSMFYPMFKYLVLSLDCVLINLRFCVRTHHVESDIT